MSTETRNPRSFGLDKMSPQEMVRLFNEEEFVVIRALQSAEKQIAQAAEHAAQAFQRGGRIIYIGSGTSGRVAAMDAAEMPPTFGIEDGRYVAIVAGGTKAEKKANEHAEDDEHQIVVTLNEMSINPKDISSASPLAAALRSW